MVGQFFRLINGVFDVLMGVATVGRRETGVGMLLVPNLEQGNVHFDFFLLSRLVVRSSITMDRRATPR